MRIILAATAAVDRAPAGWARAPFRRLAKLQEATNADGQASPLSLGSNGEVYPRTTASDRQQASEGTIRRGWLVRPDDLVVNPMWLIGGGIGVSSLAGFVSPDYRVYGLGPRLLPRFAHHLLRSAPYLDQYRLYTRAETTFDRRVSKEDFESTRIPIPTQREQAAIADFLDRETARIDAAIEARRAVRMALREHLACELDEAVSLAPAGATPLKYLAREVTVGIVVRPADLYTEELDGVPALRGTNIAPFSVSMQELVLITRQGHREHSKSELAEGDVVVVRTGQAGAAAVVPGWADGANAVDLLIVRPGPSVLPAYLELVLNARATRSRIEEHSVGSLQAHFNVGSLREVPVPLLPLSAQEAFVARFTCRRRLVDAADSSSEDVAALLREYRQSLITEAATGQLDVTRMSERWMGERLAAASEGVRL